jgi:hypothetical protein
MRHNMKYFCQLCAGAMLILSLALSAHADSCVDGGHASCPAIASQPSSATLIGDAECPGRELAVSVLEEVLLLF